MEKNPNHTLYARRRPDGAPCHTAKSVKQWLGDCEVDYIKDWPGNSPDLNPIENMRGLMKRKLLEVDTSKVPRLIAAIRALWANFPQDHLRLYASSLPKRMEDVIKRKGYSI